MSSDPLGHVIAFSSLGVLSVTQELAGTVLSDLGGAEPDLIAEETLCLVATTTARAAAVGLRDASAEARDPIVDVLENIPFVYQDYLLGGELLDRSDPSIAGAADDIRQRLEGKHAFYRVHFPENQFPGEKVLTEKMALWMGRISPPRLPEMPSERLGKLALVAPLSTHLKLVLAYCRNGSDRS